MADVFPIINNRASILGALPVMRLLAKYSCTVHLTAARTALTCLVMEHDVCPLEVFVLGAAVRDIALCRTAIVYGDDGDDLAPRDAEARAAALQSYWHDVDPVYRAALAKAWEVQDPKDRGNRFVEAMCLEGEQL